MSSLNMSKHSVLSARFAKLHLHSHRGVIYLGQTSACSRSTDISKTNVSTLDGRLFTKFISQQTGSTESDLRAPGQFALKLFFAGLLSALLQISLVFRTPHFFLTFSSLVYNSFLQPSILAIKL